MCLVPREEEEEVAVVEWEDFDDDMEEEDEDDMDSHDTCFILSLPSLSLSREGWVVERKEDALLLCGENVNGGSQYCGAQ